MKALLLGTAALIGLSAPAFAGDNDDRTIAQIVGDSGGEFDQNYFDYDILLTALQTAELDDDLNDPSIDWTVFAPNDFAFVLTARDLGFDGIDEEGAWLFLVDALTDLGDGNPIPVLTNILLYHVAPEDISAFRFILRSFFRQDIQTALAGATFRPFFLFLIDNDPDIANPTLFFPLDLKASNGRIHTIRRVLIPLDI